jgi:AcrR family transcriptional regulator
MPKTATLETVPLKAATRGERLRQGSAARRSKGKQELKQQILEAAIGLFESKGYEGFSLRQVAEEIGYSPTAIYLHFRDKDALLLTVALEGFRAFGEALQAAYFEHRHAPARLTAIGTAYVRFGLSHPLQYRLMFMQRGEFLSHEPPEGYESFIDSFGVLLRTIEEGMVAGEIKRGDPRGLAGLLWSAAHGVVSLAIGTSYFSADQVEGMFAWHMQILAREFRASDSS